MIDGHGEGLGESEFVTPECLGLLLADVGMNLNQKTESEFWRVCSAPLQPDAKQRRVGITETKNRRPANRLL